jgi:hypothetical protein
MVKPALILFCLLAVACVAPPGAAGAVYLFGNGRGDQAIFQSVHNQPHPPMYAATRPAGRAFGPLEPVSSAGGSWSAQATVGDGGSVVAVLSSEEFGSPTRSEMTVRPPGGGFGPPLDLARGAGEMMQFASNARGDTIIALHDGYGAYTEYRFRPAGGSLRPPAALPATGNIRRGDFAVDPDGTVLFVWTDRDGHAFESRRPPGGEFGAPVALDQAYYDFAAASNGRAILLFGGGEGFRSTYAVERPPGGDFGAPFLVRRNPGTPSSAAGISEEGSRLAIAPSGAAALFVAGFPGVSILARDPGGKFRDRGRLPFQGSQMRLAVANNGAVAVARHTSLNGVWAAYRPAGGRVGKGLTLVRPSRSIFGYAEPPGLTIDRDGLATAAWASSDGRKIRTYVRSFDKSGLRRRRVVDALPTYVREGPPSACRPPGAQLLRSTRQATVFVASDAVYGCLLARGKPVRLTDPESDDSTQRGGISLRGPLVAYMNDQPPPPGQSIGGVLTGISSAILVTDLRGTYGVVDGARLDGLKATLLASRLKSNGAVAFIYKTRGTKKYVRLKDAYTSRDARLVDSGRRIDAKSLRLRGSTVTWRNAGKLRRARLR